jgi:hypothetical protein
VFSFSLMLMYGTKYQQCSLFVLGFGVFKLLIILKPYDWLRAHSIVGDIHLLKVDEPLSLVLNWSSTNQMSSK